MTPKERAEQKAAEGICLVCGKKFHKLQRGLCVPDYQKFRRGKVKVGVDRRKEFESRLIDEGKLLPKRQGDRGGDNPFSLLAEEMNTESSPPPATRRKPSFEDITSQEKLAGEKTADQVAPASDEKQEKPKRRKSKKK